MVDPGDESGDGPGGGRITIVKSPKYFNGLTITDQVVEDQFESVKLWLKSKDSKGRIRCFKLERMLQYLIHGGGYLAAANEGRGGYCDDGMPDFVMLRHCKIQSWLVKNVGTNKTRPIYGALRITPEDLLWATAEDGGSPRPIGHFSPGQVPDVTIKIYANWALDLQDDAAREGYLFDLLKNLSHRGPEYPGLQKWETVGHDMTINRDTIALYGVAVADSFLAAEAVKKHAVQLGFPLEPVADATKRDRYEAAQVYMRELGAKMFRPSDGAVLDEEGQVLYFAQPVDSDDDTE